MPRTLNRLSPLKVQKLKRRGLHADGGGLYLRVSESGTKAWMFRFGENGKLRDMGLGPLHTISLPRARELARECRELRLQGIDPIAHRKAALAARKASDAKAATFRQCADAYIANHEGAWRSAAHRQQWTNTLAQYVDPVLGDLPIAAIDTVIVLKVVEPLWKSKTETGARVRGRIEAVLDWAKARGFRGGDNPARWRGHLDHLLPARRKLAKVEHHAALPYAEIGTFMAALRQETGVAARCLEFIVLTGARLGEATNAEWSEIDLPNRIWTVPPSRMKSFKEHRAPLSDAALTVLDEMQSIRHSDYIFPGGRKGRPLGKHPAVRLAKLASGRDVTVHGFRSTFRDWAAERTNFPREIAEMALAHSVGNSVEAAYRRSDLFDKRRKLMDAWAEFCARPVTAGAVVAIRRGRS
jgi:integrase